MNKYPKSDGALFPHKKTSEKQPDLRGKVAITRDQMIKLKEMAEAGLEPTLQVAAWNRKSSEGRPYVYISAEAYMKEQAPKQQSVDRFMPEDDTIPF